MVDGATSESTQEAPQDLWMVQAIIQGFRLDAVTLALEQVPGFAGMTVSDCRGFGREKLERGSEEGHHPERGRARPDADVTDFTPKLRVDVAVAGRDCAIAVVDAIARTARTGRSGDGKVFSWPISHAVRVRTFETGPEAL